ncbi:zinc finger, CCHC-type containing protein [Tanacetum coccineum]|uniref:Zinc finger, CCHC-type containing protein n=1 Tax=Tanacetum coccineum TaxID=301880 RepID=A0ABQ5HN88_9ASTR
MSLINETEEIGPVVPEKVTEEVVVQQPEAELRIRKRNRTPKNFKPEFQLYLIEGTRDEFQDVAFWKEAINDEMDSIMGNNTWVLADLPPGTLDQAQVDMTKEFCHLGLGSPIERTRINLITLDCGTLEKVLPWDTSEKLMPNNLGKLSSLTYTVYPSVLEGYTDARWISNTKDNLFTNGCVFLLSGGAISWASKKKTCITSSIMESEFVALAAAGKEAEWLRNLILEIPLWSKFITPISIRCDSAATLAKAYS